jgi:hypothetical protein
MNDELRREMDSHIAMRTEHNMQAGMSPEEASKRARLSFGNAEAIREEIYEWNGFGCVSRLGMDFRYAARSLMQSKLLVLVAFISLSICVGANTTIFSLINAIFLRPLPVSDPYHVVFISQSDATQRPTGLNQAMIRELKGHTSWFTTIVGRSGDRPVAVEYNNAMTAGNVYSVSTNFYSDLGIHPVLGRILGSEDDAPPGAAPSRVAVLGYEYWEQRFGGETDILGKTIKLDHVPFTIVGVTGKEYSGIEIGQPNKLRFLWGRLSY